MATHSSILAWRIPWMEEPGRLQSMGAARLDTGRLAGSILKINEAIKNLMDFTGIGFIDAVRCATENPAKNLGMFNEIGSIKEGKKADLVVVDKDIKVYQTIKEGIEIFSI